MTGIGNENPLAAGAPATVRLVKHRGDIEYPATVLRDDGDHVVVRAPWSGPDVRDFGYVRFEKGDVFTEHFWRTRWYAVKEVRTADGALKGWYCDIARPAAVEGTVIIAPDLELDLWLSADRTTVLRLDEDEFQASGLIEDEPATAEAARRALDELEALVADGGFDALLLG